MRTVVLNVESKQDSFSRSVNVQDLSQIIVNVLNRDINAEISIHSDTDLILVDVEKIRKDLSQLNTFTLDELNKIYDWNQSQIEKKYANGENWKIESSIRTKLSLMIQKQKESK